MPLRASCIAELSLLLLGSALGCGQEAPESPQPAATALRSGADRDGPPHEVRICLEIDQMVGTPEVPRQAIFPTDPAGRPATLAELIPPPLVLEVAYDDARLPGSSVIAAADLPALRHWHQRHDFSAPCAAKVWALVAHRATDPGLDGELFETRTRTGIVVYTGRLPADAGLRDAELLRRVGHELLHALNAHHEDFTDDRPPGGFHQAGTVESYAPIDAVRWAIGDLTRAHLRGHPRWEIVPNTGFAFGNVVPAHADRHPLDWSSKLRPGSGDQSLATATTFGEGETDSGLVLLLAARSPVELGEPLTLSARLRNTAGELQRPPELDPRHGFLRITVQDPAGDTRRFFPLQVRDRFDPAESTASLPAGGELAATVDLFYGTGGWTFPRPGVYEVQARYVFADGTHRRLVAEPLRLEVTAPDPSRQDAVDALLARDEDAPLDSVGAFLVRRGGLPGSWARRRLEEFVAEQFDTPQGASFRLALAEDALRPALDPEDGRRPPPDLERAEALLDGLLDPERVVELPARDLLRAHLLLGAGLAEVGDSDGAQQAFQASLRALPEDELRRISDDPELVFEWQRLTDQIDLSATDRALLFEAGAINFYETETPR